MVTNRFKVETYSSSGSAGMPLPIERKYPVSALVEKLNSEGIRVVERKGNSRSYVLRCAGLEIAVDKYETVNSSNKRQTMIGATVYHRRGYECQIQGVDTIVVERILTEFYTGQKQEDTTSPEWRARLKDYFR